MNIVEFAKAIEKQRKERDSIYHYAAQSCGLSDTALWVVYIVSDWGEPCTQYDLCHQFFYPKQTINTAIKSLMRGGYVVLEVIAGTRNRKKIILTEKGEELAKNTADKLRDAELCAYLKITQEERTCYLELTVKLISYLREETGRVFKKI